MFLHQSFDVKRLRLSDCLELLVKGILEVRAHVMRVVAEIDLEALVAENLLLFTEDRVGEFGAKRRDSLRAILSRPDEADRGCLRGVFRPYGKEIKISLTAPS